MRFPAARHCSWTARLSIPLVVVGLLALTATDAAAETATGVASAAAPQTSQAINRYVTLGDSVAYGHGLANPYASLQTNAAGYNQGPSPLAWPSLVQSALGYSMSRRNTNCELTGDQLAISGALGADANAPSIPPPTTSPTSQCPGGWNGAHLVHSHPTVQTTEYDAAGLASRPASLVTIQAGADDIRFADCLIDILLDNVAADGPICVQGGLPTPTVESELTKLTSGLVSTIEDASPDAQEIAVVDYYDFIPSPSDLSPMSSKVSDGKIDPVCWLLKATDNDVNSSSYADSLVLQSALDGAIARAVTEARGAGYSNVKLVTVDGAMNGHEMCASQSYIYSGEQMRLGDLMRLAAPLTACLGAPLSVALPSAGGALALAACDRAASDFVSGIKAYAWRTGHPNSQGQEEIAKEVEAQLLSVTTSSLPAGTVGDPYSAELSAAGSGDLAVTWSIPPGALPPGLTLDPHTGMISGTPTTAGKSNITVKATDAFGGATADLQLTVNASTEVSGNAPTVVSDGYSYCALSPAKSVDCWGWNQYDNLGNGSGGSTDAFSDAPTAVTGVAGSGTLGGVASLRQGGGWGGYCVVSTTGGVDCWGYGSYGDLGNGSAVNSAVPVAVEGVDGIGTLGGVADVASEYSGAGGYCALLVNGAVDCWGDDDYGELGSGPTPASEVPNAVKGVGDVGTLGGVASVVGGLNGYCAVLTSGAVDCWGDDTYGQLGNGTDGSTFDVPVAVEGVGGSGTLGGVASITADDSGGYCALLTSGGVDCWGRNFDGALGDGTELDSNLPVVVRGVGGATTLTGVASVTSAGAGYCAVLTGGGVDCWGRNVYGELGDGTTTNADAPVAVKAVDGVGMLSGAASVTADIGSGYGYCAVLTSGSVDCWGENDGTSSFSSNTPVAVQGVAGAPALGGVASLASDAGGYCASLTSGGVDCWGGNQLGQLGNGTTASSDVPVPVSGIGPPP